MSNNLAINDSIGLKASRLSFSSTNLFVGARGFGGNDFAEINLETKQKALNQVDNDLVAVGLLDKRTKEVSKETKVELSFEVTTSLPTPGLMVKSCLDECSVCETTLEKEIHLDLERKHLENELLKRQIELLDKSKEYNPCPETEKVEEDA